LQTVTAKSQVPEKESTYGCAQTPLTPQLTPDSPKPGPVDTNTLPPDLAEIVAVWPELPGHIKAAIKALVQSAAKEGGVE